MGSLSILRRAPYCSKFSCVDPGIRVQLPLSPEPLDNRLTPLNPAVSVRLHFAVA